MSDYISREAAIHVCEYSFWPENVKRRIKELPAADVVDVVHGEWNMYPIADGMNQCSKCGLLRFGESNYCPNCGAKMDGR